MNRYVISKPSHYDKGATVYYCSTAGWVMSASKADILSREGAEARLDQLQINPTTSKAAKQATVVPYKPL